MGNKWKPPKGVGVVYKAKGFRKRSGNEARGKGSHDKQDESAEKEEDD